MDIIICGHSMAIQKLMAKAKEYDVIFISNPDESKFDILGSERIPELSREYCELLFEDVIFSRGTVQGPELCHIKKALEFSKNRRKLLVTCQAGISRSSAIAYLIKSVEVGSKQALNLLNSKIHYPNELVIRYGADLLKDENMVELIKNWKLIADKEPWH